MCVFNDGVALNSDSASAKGSAADTRAKPAAGCSDFTAANRNISVAGIGGITIVATTTDAGGMVITSSGNLTTRNCHIAIASGGVIVSAATNTGTVIAATGSDFAASNGYLSVISEAAADTGTASTTVGGKFTVVIIVRNGQSAAGFLSLGICFFIMLQTGMTRTTRQSIITVQLNVRIAAAGNAYSGVACFAGVDIDVIQRDIHRLSFICIDRYCIRRRGRSVAVCNNRVRIILSCFTILCDIVAAFTSRNRDVTIFNVPCTRKGGERHPDHKGGGEGEGGGALSGGAAGCFDRRNRAVPQNTHGEFAIRDHKWCLLSKFQIR